MLRHHQAMLCHRRVATREVTKLARDRDHAISVVDVAVTGHLTNGFACLHVTEFPKPGRMRFAQLSIGRRFATGVNLTHLVDSSTNRPVGENVAATDPSEQMRMAQAATLRLSITAIHRAGLAHLYLRDR
jgi:hypothetical protein